MIKPQTLKGFRDFLPSDARKRQYITSILKDIFEQYGFEPLETPVLEYEEILTGKYGDEGEKLMYKFEDNGKRRVAMRYDLTVPLARVIAQHQNSLSYPFKRYQMQYVYRAENTQKGRFREFIQCDVDTIGTDSALSDAEIISLTYDILKKLNFKNFKILINDRDTFKKIPKLAIPILDKIKKIGEKGIIEELISKNICNSNNEAENLIRSIINSKPTDRLLKIFKLLDTMNLDKSYYEFSPTLARGMDYYTGMIVEVESQDYPFGSLVGGGRYNNLIGMFTKTQIPAVGISFGRIFDAISELKLYPQEMEQSSTKFLVTIFSEELKENSTKACQLLRGKNINTEIYLGEIKTKNPLEKQLKYADQKGIPYSIIIGEQETETNTVTLKNMRNRTQVKTTLQEIIKKNQE